MCLLVRNKILLVSTHVLLVYYVQCYYFLGDCFECRLDACRFAEATLDIEADVRLALPLGDFRSFKRRSSGFRNFGLILSVGIVQHCQCR